jgi:hypothetical protein
LKRTLQRCGFQGDAVGKGGFGRAKNATCSRQMGRMNKPYPNPACLEW